MDKRRLRERLKAQLITTIAECLEEITACGGGGYDTVAAEYLIDLLLERGYEIKDVATGKAVEHDSQT